MDSDSGKLEPAPDPVSSDGDIAAAKLEGAAKAAPAKRRTRAKKDEVAAVSCFILKLLTIIKSTLGSRAARVFLCQLTPSVFKIVSSCQMKVPLELKIEKIFQSHPVRGEIV